MLTALSRPAAVVTSVKITPPSRAAAAARPAIDCRSGTRLVAPTPPSTRGPPGREGRRRSPRCPRLSRGRRGRRRFRAAPPHGVERGALLVEAREHVESLLAFVHHAKTAVDVCQH